MPDQPKEYEIDEQGNVTFPKEVSRFEPIAVGDYDVIIQTVEQRFSKDEGNPYFAIEFRTTCPEPTLDNKPIWENVSPSVHWRMTQLFEAVYGKQAVEEGTKLKMNIFDLFGAQIRVRLGLETGRDGVIRNTISRYYAAGEGQGPLLAEAAVAPARKPAAKPNTVAAKKRRPTR